MRSWDDDEIECAGCGDILNGQRIYQDYEQNELCRECFDKVYDDFMDEEVADHI
jgi:hypothetical protein